MADAPEKIGRFDYGRGDVRYTQPPLFITGQTNYIRADLAVLATTHQRTLEALREAREALLVFAAFSDKAERFVEHKAKFGGTAIFPVKDFRLAHFRKAVEVVALIDSILPGDTP